MRFAKNASQTMASNSRRVPHLCEAGHEVAPGRRLRIVRRHGKRHVPPRLCDPEREQRTRHVEAGDDDVSRSHAEKRENASSGKRARDACGVAGRARDAHRADQPFGRHRLGDQRAAHADIGGSDEARKSRNDQHQQRRHCAGKRQCHQERPKQRVAHPHGEQDVAVSYPVARDPEQRRDQRAEILHRAENRQPQHRAGFDQHVPAEDDRLHLERPRGQQVGGPLETETADRKRRDDRNGAAGRAAAARLHASVRFRLEVSVRRSSILRQ